MILYRAKVKGATVSATKKGGFENEQSNITKGI